MRNKRATWHVDPLPRMIGHVEPMPREPKQP
jgi:hypothetical protein